MKTFFISLLLVFSALSASSQNTSSLERHWKKDVEKLRVISYNILDGFGWGKKDSDRQERLVAWIKGQDPEIVGLQELCGFNEQSLQVMALRWGHPYAVILKEGGYPVGITSKRPITIRRKITEGIGHGLLHAQTYGYEVLVTHLNPHNASKRHAEAAAIVTYIRENGLHRCILMGDMNSHSPMDADYMEGHATRLQAKYGGAESKNLLNGEFDYTTISQYLSLPLIDVCQRYVAPASRLTYPTRILMSESRHSEVRQLTAERLDYIFISPDLESELVDAFIFNGTDTDYLSDHYPIAMDLLVQHE